MNLLAAVFPESGYEAHRYAERHSADAACGIEDPFSSGEWLCEPSGDRVDLFVLGVR